MEKAKRFNKNKFNVKSLSVEEKAFYHGLTYNLKAIFGDNIFDLRDGEFYVSCYTSTTGWDAALRNTCISLKFVEIYKLYEQLAWDVSDLVDGWVANNLIAIYNYINHSFNRKEVKAQFAKCYYLVSTNPCDYSCKKIFDQFVTKIEEIKEEDMTNRATKLLDAINTY